MAANGFDTETDDRRAIVRFGKWLYRLGFMPGTSGNLSVRIGADCILATPTGCSKYLMRPADIVTVDLEGNQWWFAQPLER